MFEESHEQVIPSNQFSRRIFKSFGAAGILVTFALAVGVSGYHWIAQLDWIDAIYNASMILTGMGPVNELPTAGAKLFASAYALFCGIIVLGASAVLLAPLAHRLLHLFHRKKQELPS